MNCGVVDATIRDLCPYISIIYIFWVEKYIKYIYTMSLNSIYSWSTTKDIKFKQNIYSKSKAPIFYQVDQISRSLRPYTLLNERKSLHGTRVHIPTYPSCTWYITCLICQVSPIQTMLCHIQDATDYDTIFQLSISYFCPWLQMWVGSYRMDFDFLISWFHFKILNQNIICLYLESDSQITVLCCMQSKCGIQNKTFLFSPSLKAWTGIVQA